MSLSPNEIALIDKALEETEASYNTLLYVSDNGIDEDEIIECLSMDITGLELARQQLIAVRNKVNKRRKKC